MRTRGFSCHNCGVWFGVFPNASMDGGHNGGGHNEAGHNGASQSFSLECPNCQQSDEYSAKELVELGASEPSARQA